MIVNACITAKRTLEKIFKSLASKESHYTLEIQVLNPSGRLHVVKYNYKNIYFLKIYTTLGTVNKPALPEKIGVTGSSKQC